LTSGAAARISGVDLRFELGKILLEHADPARARGPCRNSALSAQVLDRIEDMRFDAGQRGSAPRKPKYLSVRKSALRSEPFRGRR